MQVRLGWVRKTFSDGADVTCCGRLFQTRALATGKARSPMVDSRVRRKVSDDDETGDVEPRIKSAGWLSTQNCWAAIEICLSLAILCVETLGFCPMILLLMLISAAVLQLLHVYSRNVWCCWPGEHWEWIQQQLLSVTQNTFALQCQIAVWSCNSIDSDISL